MSTHALGQWHVPVYNAHARVLLQTCLLMTFRALASKIDKSFKLAMLPERIPLPQKKPARWKRLKSRQGPMQIRKELNLTYNLNRNTALTRTPCLFFGVLSCWLNLITLQNNQSRCSTINLDAFFRSWACGRSGFEMIGGTPKTTRRLDDDVGSKVKRNHRTRLQEKRNAGPITPASQTSAGGHNCKKSMQSRASPLLM